MLLKILITITVVLICLPALTLFGWFYVPVYVYIILCAADIGILGYFFVYKWYVNAALKGERKGRLRMPSIYQVIIVILTAAGVAGLISMSAKITELEDQVSNLAYRVSSLNQDINRMYTELLDRQEQMESLVNSIDWKYGAYDAGHQTADIIFAVVPKNVSNQAELTLSLGGAQTTLTEDGTGAYTGTISVSIFEDMGDAAILTIEQDGVKRTEVIDDLYISSIWNYYLPGIGINLFSEIDETKDGETKTWNVSVECRPSEYDSSYTMQAVRMITVLNDEVISEEDLLAKPAQGSLQEGLSIEFEKQETYKKTDNLLIYIEATDRNGLTYKEVLYKWYDETECIYMDSPDIFDADGKQLIKNAF